MSESYVDADLELRRSKDVGSGVENLVVEAIKHRIGPITNPSKGVQIFIYAPTFNTPEKIIRSTPVRWIVAIIFLVLMVCWLMFDRR